ncbi:MAG: kelch repeat-containing protein [Deferrisomatales bacterium]|nr:kelch repeat-containing protein [Deferrisomatales bacterium]
MNRVRIVMVGLFAWSLAVLFAGSAWAAPRLVQYQGRLEDAGGPVNGLVDLEFIFSADADGLAPLWSEMHLDVPVASGVFAVGIGSVDVSGVPVELFPSEGAWLEVVVNGEALSPRQQLASSLYALQALYAENATFAFTADTLDGLDSADLDQRAHLADTANPHQVTATDVGAVSAADLAGHTGNAAAHHAKTTSFADLADQAADSQLPASIARDSELTWTNLTGVPAGFADGVDDTATLSEAQVENYVTNGALDLFPGSSMGGLPLATGAHTTSLDWGSLTNVPAGFADGVDANSQLSEFEVENYVTNGALNLAPGTTVGGQSIATGVHTTSLGWSAVTGKPAGFDDDTDNDTLASLDCATDQIARWNGAVWVCADETPAASGVPSGFMIIGSTSAAPPGYTYTGSTVAATSAGLGTWMTKAPIPSARGWFPVAAVNNKLYAIGGAFASNGADTNLTEEYDPATDTWTTRAPMPLALEGLALAVVDGKIYVVGGMNEPVGEISTSTFEYDPTTDTWTQKAGLNFPRVYGAAAVVNGKIYAVGGVSMTHLLDTPTEEYDPATDTWTVKTPMLTGRQLLSAVGLNGKVYAMGGYDALESGGTTLGTLEEYDPPSDTWRALAPMLTPRAAFGATVLGDAIYAFGGSVFENGSTTDVTETYSPVVDTWAEKEASPMTLTHGSASTAGGKAYVVGFSGTQFSMTRVTLEYSPGSSVMYLHRKD